MARIRWPCVAHGYFYWPRVALSQFILSEGATGLVPFPPGLTKRIPAGQPSDQYQLVSREEALARIRSAATVAGLDVVRREVLGESGTPPGLRRDVDAIPRS